MVPVRRYESCRIARTCRANGLERLSSDIASFRRRNRLDHVVVVNLASCEPPAPSRPAHASFKCLERELGRAGSNVLPASSLYALAAIESGCAFVNFTPSLGVAVPAIRVGKRAGGTDQLIKIPG